MAGTPKTISRKKKRPASPGAGSVGIRQHDFKRFEFYRNACALIPSPDDPSPGVASMVIGRKSVSDQRHCTCAAQKGRTCPHLIQLAAIEGHIRKQFGGKEPQEVFQDSPWYRLARFMGERCKEAPASLQMHLVSVENQSAVAVRTKDDRLLLTYLSEGADRLGFIQRCGPPPEEKGRIYIGKVLDELTLLTLSAAEQEMLQRGYKTRGLAFAQSFWFRMAYHGFREFGSDGLSLLPQIDETNGSFTVVARSESAGPIFRIPLPRQQVAHFLADFKELFDNSGGFCPEPVPVDAIFDVRINDELDLELLPRIRLLQKNGDFAFFGREDLKKFEYGDLQYIPELGLLTHMNRPDELVQKHRGEVKTVIERAKVPAFVERFRHDLDSGAHRIDAGIAGLQVLGDLDAVEITPLEWNEEQIRVSVRYRFASQTATLSEILQTRRHGQRFIATEAGWIDCLSPDLDGLEPLGRIASLNRPEEKTGAVTVSPCEMLRIHAAVERPVQISGEKEIQDRLRQILAMAPPVDMPDLSRRTSPLRPYQLLGARWLWYLHGYRLGGLLCDDMGLGKTHQIMALMACLARSKDSPFLVVCPTTVLSHWEKKIKAHAPGLTPVVHHGPYRDPDRVLAPSRVMLTTYGILRRDAPVLGQIRFSLAVFDEVQYLKNADTQAHAAAATIGAEMKIGLTGTPIENNVGELKALMDLVLPGYLGPSGLFEQRYRRPIEENADTGRRKELGRIIAPFVLRRLKKSVLSELPAKIEDIRTCTMAPDQHLLYADTLEERRQGLLEKLQDPQGAVPYMHIFALLNRLKQICDHPALVLDGPGGYQNHGSGKWELFTDLLAESLESGQKIVIYSQYLAMIDIIAGHLENAGVGTAVLTGKSRNRGGIIDRFNTDPACRVFVGSLMAGGTGIDLVAASVVIHYDRWWNAAREDQATDRVHRIGQRRGVQVFKLVTEDTVEEKIARIIQRKKDLMEDVVREDDPGTLKFFTREELMDMLAMPLDRWGGEKTPGP